MSNHMDVYELPLGDCDTSYEFKELLYILQDMCKYTRFIIVCTLHILLCLWVQKIPNQILTNGACILGESTLDIYYVSFCVTSFCVFIYIGLHTLKFQITKNTSGDVINTRAIILPTAVGILIFITLFSIGTSLLILSYKHVPIHNIKIPCPISDVVGYGLIYLSYIIMINLTIMYSPWDKYPCNIREIIIE